ncbi:MAG: hypothetical protein ACD_76C00131G0003 [uncultured bacterium]|nr:MAG: hypothetical protein ACD_76C00131G0003 [uncultured bacterium]
MTGVLGLQWGDEGKGKVIDQLADGFDVVVRCQGGANAGHTVVVGGQKLVLHLLPAGVLHRRATCVIGNGVVIDPIALAAELAQLKSAEVDVASRLKISDRAHLVMPWHRRRDADAETRKGNSKVGTTQRGIGPCYEDKAARVGLRAGLTNSVDFESRVRSLADGATEDEIVQVLQACREMSRYVCDTFSFLHEQAERGAKILFEGAQGAMLDIDFGTYPYVTSSSTGIGGIITGSGLPPKYLGEVIGILKAYSTRVGNGPFPTELLNSRGDAIRERGAEYGATTGRPRRCGWLDLVVGRFACRLNGVNSIALTKLDVLCGESELRICAKYRLHDREFDGSVPARLSDYEAVTPVYTTMNGWEDPIRSCRRFADLPNAAQNYILAIENHLAVPIRWIGTGPDRDDVIKR